MLEPDHSSIVAGWRRRMPAQSQGPVDQGQAGHRRQVLPRSMPSISRPISAAGASGCALPSTPGNAPSTRRSSSPRRSLIAGSCAAAPDTRRSASPSPWSSASPRQRLAVEMTLSNRDEMGFRMLLGQGGPRPRLPDRPRPVVCRGSSPPRHPPEELGSLMPVRESFPSAGSACASSAPHAS